MNVIVMFYVVLTVMQPEKKQDDLIGYQVKSNLGEIGTLYTQAKYKVKDTIWVLQK